MLPLSFILGKKDRKIDQLNILLCRVWRKKKLRSGTLKQYKN